VFLVALAERECERFALYRNVPQEMVAAKDSRPANSGQGSSGRAALGGRDERVDRLT